MLICKLTIVVTNNRRISVSRLIPVSFSQESTVIWKFSLPFHQLRGKVHDKSHKSHLKPCWSNSMWQWKRENFCNPLIFMSTPHIKDFFFTGQILPPGRALGIMQIAAEHHQTKPRGLFHDEKLKQSRVVIFHHYVTCKTSLVSLIKFSYCLCFFQRIIL